MSLKSLVFVLIVIHFSQSGAVDLVYKSGFGLDDSVIGRELNDTGMTWAASQTSINTTECTSDISALQDCHQGRDYSVNDNTDGYAGFTYTKLDINGSMLPQEAENWSCVKDNVTGLIWEVKTDSGIHSKNNRYRWGGLTAIGREHPQREGDYFDSWNDLINDSNGEVFCGKTNWRVPSVNELLSLVNRGRENPSIDIDYFPNTKSSLYWTSYPFLSAEFTDQNARIVSFYYGGTYNDYRSNVHYIRLVSE